MNALTSPRPENRAWIAAITVLALVVAAGAWLDPSGLLAPVSGRGLPLLGGGGVYQWAPLLIGLPILLAGTAVPVRLLARPGRPTASARWIFAVAWAATVAAAGLAAAATGFAAALPMAGPHLSLGAVLTFSVATSGFAATKFLLIGPVAAAAAALAYRTGPTGDPAPPLTADDLMVARRCAVAAMFPVVMLGSAAFGAHWWRGGSLGYAFSGPLLAPTATSGLLGFLAFLLAFAAIVRPALRRLGSSPGRAGAAAAVLVASTVAGFGLAVLNAVLAALPWWSRLPDAGRDDWWIATTLIHLGTGLGFGAVIGVLGAAGTGLLWRWRLAVAVPSVWAGRIRVLVTVLLLALPFLTLPDAPGPQAAAPTAATGGMERLRLLPAADEDGLATIGDATGRQVLLRGVNVNQLIDYHLRDPAVPATQPLTDGDFEQIAAMGFNVVRLGMSWSRLEPRRGEFNEAYLREIATAVASAKSHGIYTVLDMHEDAWGTSLAKPSEQCGGGTTPTTGWDGAPQWATITDGTLHCQFMARDLAPAVATAFGNFYTDRDGIQTELVRTWAFVAREFADEPAVAGFDLFNEPGIGANPPVSSGLLLGRYYDAAITAIRAAERTGQGYSHLVFFEPSVLWSGLSFDVTPPPGFTGDRELVFAPHPYSESITMDQSLGLTIASIERNLAVSARAARSYGAALWTGEWGWFGDPATDGAKVARFGAAQDRLGIGGAFWVWRQGCGSPETGADAVASGNLVRIDCATGASIAPPIGFAKPLTRAYPRAFPGRLDTLTSGGADLVFGATSDRAEVNCELDIWVPGDAQPKVSTQGVTGSATRQVPGGWRITGCARGPYTVTVKA